VSRSLRRGALAASVLALSLASLAACSAGNNAQTLGVKPDTAATTIRNINIQNATVVTQSQPDSGGPAVVTGTVFNTGRTREALQAIALPGTGTTVKLSPAKGSGPVFVPAGGSVQLGGDGNASAVIENGSEAARNGDVQQVVFTFSQTGDVGLKALVLPAVSYRKGVGPSALPNPPASPSASPSGTPQQPGEPSGTVTPSDSASASLNAAG
jgi:hypothetical protein